ncbi:MAG: GH3 family domain-containing protein [Candidatus Ranarchaeia archaeon]
MNIVLSKLLKMVSIRTRNKFVKLFDQDINQMQENVINKIISKQKNTNFASNHSFKKIKNLEDYQNHVPLRTYDEMVPYFNMILNGGTNVTTTGDLVYWIQTSGSTGKPKLIPYTAEYFKDTSALSRRLFLSSIADASKNSNPFSGNFLAITATPILGYRGDIPIGYISGAAVKQIGSSLGDFIVPDADVMNLKTWEERNIEIFKTCLPKNIVGYAGVTSYVTSLLKTLKDGLPPNIMRELDTVTRDKVRKARRYDSLDIREIWPNANLFISSGVKLGFYRDWLKDTLGDIHFREAYGASEFSSCAFQVGEQLGMLPNIDKMFFEFIPKKEFDKKGLESTTRLLLTEVKKNVDYVFAVTTAGGLYSYILGDVVSFTTTDPPRMNIVGRTKNEINLSAEKMLEEHIVQAIQYAQSKTKSLVNEFILTAKTSPLPQYVLGIEFAKPPKDMHVYSAYVEEGLKKVNPIYDEVREMGALKPLLLTVFKKGSFLEYSKRKVNEGRPLGQMKPPHITNDSVIMDELTSSIEIEIGT